MKPSLTASSEEWKDLIWMRRWALPATQRPVKKEKSSTPSSETYCNFNDTLLEYYLQFFSIINSKLFNLSIWLLLVDSWAQKNCTSEYPSIKDMPIFMKPSNPFQDYMQDRHLRIRKNTSATLSDISCFPPPRSRPNEVLIIQFSCDSTWMFPTSVAQLCRVLPREKIAQNFP